ncbi:MAG: PspA/IM30 family protein [Bacillus sp. (in: firmicutes)]
MSNLLTRMKDSLAADLNQLLGTKEVQRKADMLSYYVKECERETEKVQTSIKRQYLLKEELEKERTEAAEMAVKRARQVEIASKAGELELYDFALAEKNLYDSRVARLEELLGKVEKQLAELEVKYAEMKHRLKDMHLKRLEMMGQENVTSANKRIHKVFEKEREFSKPFAETDDMGARMSGDGNKVDKQCERNSLDARIDELEKKFEKEKSDLIQ